jgi:hypothetical protein
VAERETLSEIQQDGKVLVLLDGRKLRVRPGDFSKSRNWFLISELEMSKESDDPVYNIKVRNLEQDEEVRAMWI